MDNFQEQLFEMIGNLRQNGLNRTSKAAAVIKTPCDMIVSDNPDWEKTGDSSKAATTTQQVIDKGGSSSGDMIYKCGPHEFETRT